MNDLKYLAILAIVYACTHWLVIGFARLASPMGKET